LAEKFISGDDSDFFVRYGRKLLAEVIKRGLAGLGDGIQAQSPAAAASVCSGLQSFFT
jgi:hypothetical protein